jgi:hypothetical protein
MKRIFICFAFAAAACQKENINECDNVTFLSDQYYLDSTFKKTDTIMQERPVCGIDLQRCIDANKAAPFVVCGLNLMEIHRYKIGGSFGTPKIFK